MVGVRKIGCAWILLFLIIGAAPFAFPSEWGHVYTDEITGDRFDALIAGQDTLAQHSLEGHFSEEDGYFVTGPLTYPLYTADEHSIMYGDDEVDSWFESARVICPDLRTLSAVINVLERSPDFDLISAESYIDTARPEFPAGYRGVSAVIESEGRQYDVHFHTIQQTRWLIWFRRVFPHHLNENTMDQFNKFSSAVSEYLYAVDRGEVDAEVPVAIDFEGMDYRFDLYRDPPDSLIDGAERFENLLERYSAIYTDFAAGILSFIPSDSLLEAMMKAAPRAAFLNRAAPVLQSEFKTFFRDGGDIRYLQTLDKDIFDSLLPGEYIFAVGLSGKIRFGRRFPIGDGVRYDDTNDEKQASANESFLFPGEPVLTAGTFYIARAPNPTIVEVSARSTHYFYSVFRSQIIDDVRNKSNRYVLTLGHFFRSLNHLGISFSMVLIRKL